MKYAQQKRSLLDSIVLLVQSFIRVQFTMLIHLIDINKTVGATCNVIHHIPLSSALCAHNSRCTKFSWKIIPPPPIISRPSVIFLRLFLYFLFLCVFYVLYSFNCYCHYSISLLFSVYFLSSFIFLLVALFLFPFFRFLYLFRFVV